MPDFKLSPARWSALCIGAALAAVASAAWVNYRIDLYGLFGRNANAARIMYTNDRAGKYLLSIRYVPERFDALLLGPSITTNWDTSKIGAFRVYNGSIGGGNISESKLIAENMLASKTLRGILFCVHPFFTETHGRKGGGMDQRQFLGSLGSLQLLRDYTVALLISRGVLRPKWNEYGVYDPEVEGINQYFANRGWWVNGGVFTAPEHFNLDPVAFSDYAELIREARSRGVTVVAVTPPIYWGRYLVSKAAFDSYYSQMAALFRRDDPSIDFNKPEFESFRKRRDTFTDGSHLSREATDFIMSVIDETLSGCCGRKRTARSYAGF